MNIHQRFDELTGLARIYAEDGAFHSAAQKLRQLVDEMEAHAKACDPHAPIAPYDRKTAKQGN